MKLATLLLASLILLSPANAVAEPNKAYGIGFSPYMNGQDPNQGTIIGTDQIASRLTPLAPYFTWVRTFGSTNGLEHTPAIARRLGLKVAAGAWISSDATQNALEISNLIAAANAGAIDIAIVGSEAILRNDVTETQLIAYMNQVRQAIPSSVPVTTADVYGTFLAHPSLISASDVIFANFYPYWEGTSIQNALCALDGQYRQLVNASGTKQVIVSETGWPTAGKTVGAAVPSATNAALYAQQFFSWSKAHAVASFYFEAYDEQWKSAYEGPQGAHWGIWDASGVLKPGMDAFFNGNAVTIDCNAGIPGPVGIQYVYVPPYGSSDPLEVQVTGVRPSEYVVATYIQVGAGWWTKPTFAQSTVPVTTNGAVTIPIVTGGSDQLATSIKVYLIPVTTVPPQAAGGGLPDIPSAVASALISRTASSISGTIVDAQGSAIAGATISDPVLGSAISAPDGKYSFPNISASGPATLTVSYPNYVFPASPMPVNITASNTIANFTGMPTVDLAITSSVPPNPVVMPRNMAATIKVSNAGIGTASAVTVTVSLPSSFSSRSVSTSRGNCDASALPIVCNVGSLVPTASATISVVAIPTAAGTYNLEATVSGPDVDSNASNNQTSANVLVMNSAPKPVGDFDGDGRTEIAVYRPDTGTWWILYSSTNYTTYRAVSWGISTDIPVADFDGDGKTDIAVYRPSTGTWWILYSSTNYTTYRAVSWGISTDIPVAGDFDGDGKTDIAVYRPSTGTWWILYSSTNYTTYRAVSWGISTDTPVAGDFDGDGKTDIAVYRPSTGTWWILYSSTNYTTYRAVSWGISTDIPVAGDFDGDGKTDIAIYRPSTGTWWILYSSTNYTTYRAVSWGISTDIPVAGDFDGDGKIDIAVYRPSTGTWWILYSSTNYTTYRAVSWGISTDIPIK